MIAFNATSIQCRMYARDLAGVCPNKLANWRVVRQCVGRLDGVLVVFVSRAMRKRKSLDVVEFSNPINMQPETARKLIRELVYDRSLEVIDGKYRLTPQGWRRGMAAIDGLRESVDIELERRRLDKTGDLHGEKEKAK